MQTLKCFECDNDIIAKDHIVAYIYDQYYCDTCFDSKDKCKKCSQNEARYSGLCKNCKKEKNKNKTKQRCGLCGERINKCVYCDRPVESCKNCSYDEYKSIYCDWCI